MDTVDATRLRSDLEANATFGAVDADEGNGRTVLTGTDANRDARDRLVDRMANAGLDVRIDAVGNIRGRWTPPSAAPDAAPIATGSHLDSVPQGGIFDGPLGVYAGLEAVRAMQDAELTPDCPIDVVCFTEEEGSRFGDGLLGSSVAAGERTVDDALAMTDSEGTSLREALNRIGYQGEGQLDATDWDAWLELHIEQDTQLETADCQAGVVTTITGITHCDVTIEGEPNHAGATPMDDRTDALAAASECILDVERAANECVATAGDAAVGTVGSMELSPNATNVVPGRASLGVDIRAVDADTIDTLCDRVHDSLARIERDRGVETTFERPFDVPPAPMSDRVQTALSAAADDAGVGSLSLHSGAAHDTMHVARCTDAGLLFAPSDGGYSHSPLEWTGWTDCAAATDVLAGAIASLSDTAAR